MNNKIATASTLRVLAVAIAIITCYLLAASVQHIPAACQIHGIDNTGHNYTFNECEGN